jgi:CelD/BcsL family acetyltransferase involved in cellulose biosynthesis
MNDAAQPPPTTCRLVRGIEAASREERRWEALAAQAAEPNLFAEPWFMLHAVPLGPEPERFEALMIEREGDLLGVVPMHRQRLVARAPFERLSVYTNDFVPLAVPLVKREQELVVARALCAHLREERRVLSFAIERAATSGPVFLALLEAAREAGLIVEPRRLYTRAFFDPREPFDEYVKLHVSRKKRDQANRTTKKLAEQGALTFDTMEPNEPSLHAYVDAFLDLEASGWKGREGSALRSTPATEVFFRAVTRAAFERKRLHIVAMRLDGRPIAMKVNLLDAPTSYTYKVAYDEAFAKISPGVLLELESMRRVAALPGIRTMDSAGRGENPPFDWLWNERRPIGMFEISTGRATSDLWLMGRPAAKWLRNHGRTAIASAKKLLAR